MFSVEEIGGWSFMFDDDDGAATFVLFDLTSPRGIADERAQLFFLYISSAVGD